MPEILDVGAGEKPSGEATITLDIREDLDHIDLPGVDIGNERWPIDDDDLDKVIANHVLEHVPRENIGHVFEEVYRVLRPGGEFQAVVPHAGTWSANTDPTHHGPGGWTPDVEKYFTDDLSNYWPNLDWKVNAWADLEFPTFIRPSLRVEVQISRGALSYEIVKIPFIRGTVTLKCTMRS